MRGKGGRPTGGRSRGPSSHGNGGRHSSRRSSNRGGGHRNDHRHHHHRQGRRGGCASVISAALLAMIILICGLLFAGCAVTGGINTKMSTYWFDFTVTDVVFDVEYDEGDEHFEAKAGWKFIAVDISITNTVNEEISMFDDDFILETKGGGSKEYIPDTDEELFDYFDTTDIKVFRFELDKDNYLYYPLDKYDTIKGRLIFIVSDEVTSAQLCFTEYFGYDDQGKTFKVKLF